jgi:hypothetical protein
LQEEDEWLLRKKKGSSIAIRTRKRRWSSLDWLENYLEEDRKLLSREEALRRLGGC